ncbi:MAG TPA: type II CAAX endopeptidase family protein [Puia sp.]|jgi:hypothetical protein
MARSILRCVLYWVVFIGLLMGGGVLSSIFFRGSFTRLVYGVLGTVSAFLVTWIFLRTEKRSFRDIGLVWERGSLLRLLKGLVIGAVIFGILLFLLLQFGGLRLVKNAHAPGWQDMIGYLALLPLAFMEEVAFRSYPFLKLRTMMGLRASQLVVAVAFALYHVTNGWSLYVAFTGPLVWSLVFGLAAAWSRGIAVPTGIHVTVNVLQLLVGVAAGSGSVWRLDLTKESAADISFGVRHAGLAPQLVLLAGAILATEYFIRVISKRSPAWVSSADDRR